MATAASVVLATAAPAEAATYAYGASWLTEPLGETLEIQPSGWAQTLGTIATNGVWNNALDDAGRPPYTSDVYNSLYKQLKCHLYYRFKTPFHLDNWRPNVSWDTELATLCNPDPGMDYYAGGGDE